MSSLPDIARSIEAGTLPVPPEQLVLFYGTAGRIDLSNSTPEDLDKLSDACQPATFGVNKEDPGKLDIPSFATSFDIGSTGLVDIVRDSLLEGKDEKRRIKVEMYKLNVYGKDSFFKAHKDTPRSETMFGSLVVVFPTPHQGGEFVLRQDGHEWVIDFAKMIPDTAEKACVGYVSFFSDIEHEVRVVTAGHRVTLTYNLYFIPEKQAIPVISSPAPYEQRLRELLYTLLTNPDLLPEEGVPRFWSATSIPRTGRTWKSSVFGIASKETTLSSHASCLLLASLGTSAYSMKTKADILTTCTSASPTWVTRRSPRMGMATIWEKALRK
ncbi:hypothetical protein F5141DRAFT_1112871 [Pisolithus sp. B1]|nr:hypothetical protein F5141DRAFT_1112871 [Pisolithus sp. B1]